MMKIFIPYEKQTTREMFGGSRLRKTIKGECEVAGIPWVDSLVSEPDIAHLLSPREENLLVDMRWRKIPVVVSAFYCENDPSAAFLDPKANDRPAISSRAIRFLNRASLVLVPNETMKNLCLSSGIRVPVKVHPASINLSRFADDSVEKDVFPRYFGIHPEEHIAVSTGEYGDHASLRLLRALASASPETEFYFFGSTRRAPIKLAIRSNAHTAPRNLHFESIVQDDVYRSALLRADAYILLNSKRTESVSVLEAFAAKAQVIAIHDQESEPLIKNGETAWVVDSVEEAAESLRILYSDKEKSTIIPAYKVAESRSLQCVAANLKSIYESLLLEHA